MSWLEKINTGFFITTGDGRIFHPNWLNASQGVEFNLAEFEFPEIPGTLVKRTQPKGSRYPIEIYFQGEDHLDEAQDFKLSCNDPRAWIISHPFYGDITVQPISLQFDNTVYNVTKITGTVLETIPEDGTRIGVNPTDKIKFDKERLDTRFGEAVVIDIPKPDAKNINVLAKNTNATYQSTSKKIKTTLDAEEYFNKFNEANALIVKATQYPLEAIQSVQAVLNAPILFIDSVRNRINMLVTQFNNLRSTITGMIRKSDKVLYQNNVTVTVSAMAVASVTEPDYYNRADVVSVMDQIIESYNQMISDLDSLQSDNGGEEQGYIPDAESLTQLSDLVNYTLSNLIQIAISTKQERILFLEKDSNVIMVAHRLYGLTPDDATIDRIIADNNIGLNEYLLLKKDRRIVWYV